MFDVVIQVYCRRITVCVRKRPLNRKGNTVHNFCIEKVSICMYYVDMYFSFL